MTENEALITTGGLMDEIDIEIRV